MTKTEQFVPKEIDAIDRLIAPIIGTAILRGCGFLHAYAVLHGCLPCDRTLFYLKAVWRELTDENPNLAIPQAYPYEDESNIAD